MITPNFFWSSQKSWTLAEVIRIGDIDQPNIIISLPVRPTFTAVTSAFNDYRYNSFFMTGGLGGPAPRGPRPGSGWQWASLGRQCWRVNVISGRIIIVFKVSLVVILIIRHWEGWRHSYKKLLKSKSLANIYFCTKRCSGPKNLDVWPKINIIKEKVYETKNNLKVSKSSNLGLLMCFSILFWKLFTWLWKMQVT